jgi:hypothetical protein
LIWPVVVLDNHCKPLGGILDVSRNALDLTLRILVNSNVDYYEINGS